MKVAVFGGSFNPLHCGHAMLADTIVKELNYDKVLFVPTYTPPHKIIAANVTPVQRKEMIEEFCKNHGDGHFELESCEIDRGGISYTVETLKFLMEKYKGKLDNNRLAFVMGDEVAAEFDKWYCPDQISQMADLIITHRYEDIRVGQDSELNNKVAASYHGDFKVPFDKDNFKYPFIYLESPMLPVSSTDVRNRIYEKRSFRYLVPDTVFEYIIKNGLYEKI